MTQNEGLLIGEISRINGMVRECLTWDENAVTTRIAERKVLEMIRDVCANAIEAAHNRVAKAVKESEGK